MTCVGRPFCEILSPRIPGKAYPASLSEIEAGSLPATLGVVVGALDECVREGDVRHMLQPLRNA